MELRHLRYFVAIAEEGSFTRAARRSYVAQPALSRQIRDLEAEVGVPLFQRTPRGVRLTPAGEAFLVEARNTLERAALAVDSAREAADQDGAALRFAHGELYAHGTAVQRLLAMFRAQHPKIPLRVLSQLDPGAPAALGEDRADVRCVFVGKWPLERLEGHRLLDSSATGVLLPASHPLAASPAVTLAALRERGLVPDHDLERPPASPFVRIAAGDAWALASEVVGAPYRDGSTGVVYRPIVESPIPAWLALVWLPPPSPAVRLLVEVARSLELTVEGEDAPALIA